MSQGSEGAGGAGGGGDGGGLDFQLPEEILSVIPTDPYDQLDLARKITSMAIASRVSKLESEMGKMRQKLQDKDRLVFELEERLSRLQHANHEADSRLRIALDENVKLSKERDSLAVTAKKLNRDLAKLETFKRQLMQSLNDDNASPTETVDIGTCDQSVPKAYPDKDEETNGYTLQYSSSGSTDKGNTTDEALKTSGQRFSVTPYITPRLTPTGTPKIISTSGSPRGYSAISSPLQSSGATSPTKPHYEGRTSLSSWYSSSQQSSAANSPPRGRPLPGRTPRIDGKEFFRQARSRLSYEQFSAFLANIKELNAHKQTREETLRKAEEIFGTDNKDLYLSFQGLLNRNIH
ncbi:hypothetical protein PRUPE_4G138000 [Prunus persica]|uniref:At4g15545-like C-terminal domain-containing protein n=2 Tax=Prunus TaxID=3754 RepID=A0A251PK83_PRUPE|nr:uncharacterized protein At4g15545 [Prunus persica]ONI11973.1 hypothetical protein PRUPE_4G138000 [Prunus persica]ONI11974.1 hypothetical protein PRUPE_4G138000 [Prunus persica]BBH01489.1 hypothetical protein Prudu_011772 [Prunus dulcis]